MCETYPHLPATNLPHVIRLINSPTAVSGAEIRFRSWSEPFNLSRRQWEIPNSRSGMLFFQYDLDEHIYIHGQLE